MQFEKAGADPLVRQIEGIGRKAAAFRLLPEGCMFDELRADTVANLIRPCREEESAPSGM